jgi:hypothetical protein
MILWLIVDDNQYSTDDSAENSLSLHESLIIQSVIWYPNILIKSVIFHHPYQTHQHPQTIPSPCSINSFSCISSTRMTSPLQSLSVIPTCPVQTYYPANIRYMKDLESALVRGIWRRRETREVQTRYYWTRLDSTYLYMSRRFFPGIWESISRTGDVLWMLLLDRIGGVDYIFPVVGGEETTVGYLWVVDGDILGVLEAVWCGTLPVGLWRGVDGRTRIVRLLSLEGCFCIADIWVFDDCRTVFDDVSRLGLTTIGTTFKVEIFQRMDEVSKNKQAREKYDMFPSFGGDVCRIYFLSFPPITPMSYKRVGT